MEQLERHQFKAGHGGERRFASRLTVSVNVCHIRNDDCVASASLGLSKNPIFASLKGTHAASTIVSCAATKADNKQSARVRQ